MARRIIHPNLTRAVVKAIREKKPGVTNSQIGRRFGIGSRVHDFNSVLNMSAEERNKIFDLIKQERTYRQIQKLTGASYINVVFCKHLLAAEQKHEGQRAVEEFDPNLPKYIEKQRLTGASTRIEVLQSVYAELNRAKLSGEKPNISAISKRHDVLSEIVNRMNNALHLPREKLLAIFKCFREGKSHESVKKEFDLSWDFINGAKNIFKVVEGYKPGNAERGSAEVELLKDVAKDLHQELGTANFVQLAKKFRQETGKPARSRGEICAHFKLSPEQIEGIEKDRKRFKS